MDQELIKEIQYILSLENDRETQKKSMIKVLSYLLTITIPESIDNQLIERFLLKAYEILPSSSLPGYLAKKINFQIPRRKAISFSDSQIFSYSRSQTLSFEGEEQRKRESVSLSMTNLDPYKFFAPTSRITPGMRNETTKISLVESLLVNSFDPTRFDSLNVSREMTVPDIDINEVIKNSGSCNFGMC